MRWNVKSITNEKKIYKLVTKFVKFSTTNKGHVLTDFMLLKEILIN